MAYKFTKTGLAGVIAFCLLAYSGIIMSGQLAYAPNQSSNSVPVIDTSSSRETTMTGDGLAPTAEFTAIPTNGFVPLAVTFTDLSTGGPTGWEWDFGDGSTSSEQSPTHTYNTEGDFTVMLTVTNSAGSDMEEKTGLINANGSGNCNASFSADPTSGFVPLTVTFTDLSTGNTTGGSGILEMDLLVQNRVQYTYMRQQEYFRLR